MRSGGLCGKLSKKDGFPMPHLGATWCCVKCFSCIIRKGAGAAGGSTAGVSSFVAGSCGFWRCFYVLSDLLKMHAGTMPFDYAVHGASLV